MTNIGIILKLIYKEVIRIQLFGFSCFKGYSIKLEVNFQDFIHFILFNCYIFTFLYLLDIK